MRNMVCLASVALLVAAPLCGDALDGALDAFRAGELDKALELAEDVPADDAERPRADYLIGELRLVLGDPSGAADAFRAVLAKRAEATPASVGLGRALTLLGEHDDAEAVLKGALEREPKDAAAQRALGELWMHAEKLEEAEKLLEQVYKADKKHPMNARALVELNLRADDLDAARKVATAFSKARKDHPMGPFLLALVHERDDKDESAIEAYQEALERDDRFLDAHKNLAILCHTLSDTYQNTARVKLALTHYERYFALGGRDAELRRMHEVLVRFVKMPEEE